MADQRGDCNVQRATGEDLPPWNGLPLLALPDALLFDLLLDKVLFTTGNAKVLGWFIGRHEQPDDEDGGADQGRKVEDRRPSV